MIEQKINRSIESLSIAQLARISLALAMNHRPLTEELTQSLFSNVLNKMDKSDSKDAYYLCMALARGLKNEKKLRVEWIPQFDNLTYNLYLATARQIEQYDIY